MKISYQYFVYDVIASYEIDMNFKGTIQKTWKKFDFLNVRDNASNISDKNSRTAEIMKLKKFDLINFNVDPLKWVSFPETFKAAVGSQNVYLLKKKLTSLPT